MYHRAYYDADTAKVIHYRDVWYDNRKILAVTPDGRYFLTFLFEDYILMTQLWGIKPMAPRESLTIMGYNRELPAN